MRRACSLSPTIRAGIPRLPLRGRSRRGVPDSPGNGSSRSAHCVNVYSIIFLASGLSDASFIDLNFSGSWTGARACPSGQDSRLQQQRSVQRPLGRSEVGGAIRDAWNQGSAPPTLPRSIQHALQRATDTEFCEPHYVAVTSTRLLPLKFVLTRFLDAPL